VIGERDVQRQKPGGLPGSFGRGDTLWKVGTVGIIWIRRELSKDVGGKDEFTPHIPMCGPVGGIGGYKESSKEFLTVRPWLSTTHVGLSGTN